MILKRMMVEGWGLACRASMDIARPERRSALPCLCALERPMLALGGGCSYGDAALNEGGIGILTRRLDRMLGFDGGVLEAEAGVTIGDVVATFLPRGWMPPVMPGTGEVTLGGAVAADVHGKNHERDGTFGHHVEWLELLLADGSLVRASRAENAHLFAATLGGMGLTGMVTRLGLRLQQVASSAIAMHERRCSNLASVFAALKDLSAQHPYTVAWVDGMAGGKALGRGIAQAGDFAPAGTRVAAPGCRLTVPSLPIAAARPLTIRSFNTLYFRKAPVERRRVVDASAFFYPLDGLARWNRLYGRAGFHQFQCVVPEAVAETTFADMLRLAQADGCAPFLTVLKAMGEQGVGLLSFPQPGWTVAMDMAATARAPGVLRKLAKRAAEAGGRIYFAKDTVTPPELVADMYPRLEEFRAVLAEIDPGQRWQSDLARRLNLRGGA